MNLNLNPAKLGLKIQQHLAASTSALVDRNRGKTPQGDAIGAGTLNQIESLAKS